MCLYLHTSLATSLPLSLRLSLIHSLVLMAIDLLLTSTRFELRFLSTTLSM